MNKNGNQRISLFRFETSQKDTNYVQSVEWDFVFDGNGLQRPRVRSQEGRETLLTFQIESVTILVLVCLTHLV